MIESVIMTHYKWFVYLIIERIRDEFDGYAGFSQVSYKVVVYEVTLLHAWKVWVEDVKGLYQSLHLNY